jgi:hypothetical protein
MNITKLIWDWMHPKKRTYPSRAKEVCRCGRLITRCKNGRFVRHECDVPDSRYVVGKLPMIPAELDELDARR